MSKLVIVRLQSNRGTNIYKAFEFPDKSTRKEIKEHVDEWATYLIHNSSIEEATITIRYKKKIPKREWTKAWNNIWKRKHKVDDECDTLRAMNNAVKVKL